MINTKHATGSVELKRSLSLPLITFYGLGTIIGAGIYVLIGEVAGKASVYAPFSHYQIGIATTDQRLQGRSQG